MSCVKQNMFPFQKAFLTIARMTQRFFNILLVSTLLIFSNRGFAADEFSDDLSLDDQFNDLPAAPPTQSEVQPNAMDEFTNSPELPPSSDFTASQDLNLQNDDQAENVNLASPVELRQRGGALFGFSAGLVASVQPFNLKYDVDDDFQNHESVNKKTADFQNVGVMLRYAIAPYGSLGTDVNISYSQSQNHESVSYNGGSFSPVTTLKGELNFTYAYQLTNDVPVYAFAGLGAQKVSGKKILEIIHPMGYGWQVGAGFAINSTFNLEGLFSHYEHRVSQTLVEGAGTRGPASTVAKIDTKNAKAVNEGLSARGTFSFNF